MLPCRGSEGCAGEVASRRTAWEGIKGKSEGAFQEVCFTTRRKPRVLTHGDDFMVTGSKGSLLELEKQCLSNQIEHHRGRFGKEHQGAELENVLERDRDIVSTRSPTR